jgi:hypothetical protein
VPAFARVAAPGSARPTARVKARAGATCSTRERARRVAALKRFLRRRASERRAFFRAHRGAQRRKAFLRAQGKRLAHLRRAIAQCKPPAKPPAPGTPAGPGPPGGPSPAPAGPVIESGPGLLTGAADAPALGAIENVFAADAVVAPGETSDVNGAQLARTELQLALADGTTVGAVNALLQRLNARIVSSLAGVPLPTIRIPDPGSLAALRALGAGLAGEPALRRADLVTLPIPDQLPFDLASSGVGSVIPQLAERAAPAWNARTALAGAVKPTLVIGDGFGNGPPGSLFGVTPTAADFATGVPSEHGYLVLGLAAAAFDPAGGDLTGDEATGIFPGDTLPLRVVDHRLGLTESVFRDRLIDAIRTAPGNVVVNTSISSGCSVIPPDGCSAQEAAELGRQWAQRVHGQHLEGKYVHVSSAGNIDPATPSATEAARNSDWNAAGLANTVSVENAIASAGGAADPPRPICLNASSKRGGGLSAVGTGVTSLQSPLLGVFEADGGTSSAAPQVAGLAAYLWSLDPAQTPDQLVARLTATARAVASPGGDARCQSAAPAPAIDAYAAVLAADRPGRTPVRSALLDVADATGQESPDGQFDEHDLAAYANAFDTANGALDFGRYDLNGDGHTGGAGIGRFDLTTDRPAAWTDTATQTLLTLPVRFDETKATDPQVLCFNANSSLYTGDPAVLDQFDAERCMPPLDLTAAFPSTVTTGANAALTIHLRRPDFLVGGQPIGQEGVRLELAVSGGSIDTVTGLTGPAGDFTTNARLLAPATTLTIDITARAGAGGPVLGTKRVQATSASAPHVELVRRRGGASGQGIATARTDSGQDVSSQANGSGPPPDDFSPFGASEGAAGAAAGGGAFKGDEADFSASGSMDSHVDTTGAASVTIGGSGSCSASTHVKFQFAADDVTATAESGGGFLVEFKVLGGPLQYSITGTGSDGGGVELQDNGHPGDPPIVSDSNVSAAGTLDPGDYTVSGSASCAAARNDSVGNSFSLSFSLGP